MPICSLYFDVSVDDHLAVSLDCFVVHVVLLYFHLTSCAPTLPYRSICVNHYLIRSKIISVGTKIMFRPPQVNCTCFRENGFVDLFRREAATSPSIFPLTTRAKILQMAPRSSNRFSSKKYQHPTGFTFAPRIQSF